MQNVGAILAVEARPGDVQNLTRCLTMLEVKFHLARSVERAVQLLREMVFSEAIVAAELNLGEEPLIAHLSRLPATTLLLATGPGDDWEMESRSRFSGADFYLPRPITTETLAMALQMFCHNPAGRAVGVDVTGLHIHPP